MKWNREPRKWRVWYPGMILARTTPTRHRTAREARAAARTLLGVDRLPPGTVLYRVGA